MIKVYYNTSGGWVDEEKYYGSLSQVPSKIVESINQVLEICYYKKRFSLETLSNYVNKANKKIKNNDSQGKLIKLRCFLGCLEDKLKINLQKKFSCTISSQPMICLNSSLENSHFERNYLVRITSKIASVQDCEAYILLRGHGEYTGGNR
jgi:hypothetical protein